MYISQCLIAKNEENNIEYCLNHLKDIVDEQIVVDTGSTDRTVEKAKKAGAKIFHFEWIDDFSAARNFALDKAKGDWIIFLDCDEYFSEESVKLIKECIIKYGEKKNVDGLTCELINIDSNNNILATVKNISPRIFKRKDYIRYNKKIHEVLSNTRTSNANPLLSDVSKHLKIFHTGYDKEEVKNKNKNERNENLLKKELEENPEDCKLNLYLSKQLNMEGKYEEALNYSLKSLEYMDKSLIFDYYYTIYSNIMINMIALSMPYIDIKKIFDEAIKNFPDYPDYYMHISTVTLRENMIDESIEYLEKCIYYCEHYTKDIESFTIGKIDRVYTNLLNAYRLSDNKPKIVELAVALLKTNKYDFERLTILIKTFLTQEKEEDIIIFLNKLYDISKFKDKLYLLKASEFSGGLKLSEFYRSLLNEEELEVVQNSKLTNESE
ncbi:glycosyltransferase [Sedimentibacter sp. MB31-C6]|uniref:glycosyltransferase n=1 Tax=Sedimentibacter sp. MB31-C6 TaxID=3109366 RepID=UPI002DDDB7EC|nr:glycosyltransferase [Sedimentibacter sp. MB36-C1]WSI04970.1 glycosyltransferase [Sedimentibacter sp. MB36-C1]